MLRNRWKALGCDVLGCDCITLHNHEYLAIMKNFPQSKLKYNQLIVLDISMAIFRSEIFEISPNSCRILIYQMNHNHFSS